MSGDDPAKDMPDEAARTTQPTITAVFELLREIKQSVDANNARLDAVNARLDATNTRLDATDGRLDEMEARHVREFASLNLRLDEMESRHARDFASLNARIDALAQEMRDGFDRLAAVIERNREHAEADYVKFHRRLRDLESKVS